MSNRARKGILQIPEKFSFKWKIERSFADRQAAGDKYESPDMQIRYDGEITKWHLSVYPKGEDKDEDEDEGYVPLYLNFECAKDIKVPVKFQCSLLNKQNSVFHKLAITHTFNGPSDNIGWKCFILRTNINDNRNKILVDDTLTILCEISFLPLGLELTKSFHDYDDLIDEIENGFSDYEQLLDGKNFADVTFNVQGKKISLHKAVLSCRNPVFKAMFEHDMKEKRKSIVDIADIDHNVMKELFRFIYSGKVKNIDKIASDLLIAADKYQVVGLKALCEKTLYDKLTIDNAVEYLKLTDTCDTIHLKRLIIKFIAAHHKDVVEKPGFEDLNNKVMHQIMLAVAGKNGE